MGSRVYRGLTVVTRTGRLSPHSPLDFPARTRHPTETRNPPEQGQKAEDGGARADPGPQRRASTLVAYASFRLLSVLVPFPPCPFSVIVPRPCPCQTGQQIERGWWLAKLRGWLLSRDPVTVGRSERTPLPGTLRSRTAPRRVRRVERACRRRPTRGCREHTIPVDRLLCRSRHRVRRLRLRSRPGRDFVDPVAEEAEERWEKQRANAETQDAEDYYYEHEYDLGDDGP